MFWENVLAGVVAAIVVAIAFAALRYFRPQAQRAIPRLLGRISVAPLQIAMGAISGFLFSAAINSPLGFHPIRTIVLYAGASLALIGIALLPYASRQLSKSPHAELAGPPKTSQPPHVSPPAAVDSRPARADIPEKAVTTTGLKAWLEHELERGYEYRSQAEREVRRLVGETNILDLLNLGSMRPSSGVMLRRLTSQASEWSSKVSRRLDAETELSAYQSRFAGSPPPAHRDPTQGDFHRLVDYLQDRLDALEELVNPDAVED